MMPKGKVLVAVLGVLVAASAALGAFSSTTLVTFNPSPSGEPPTLLGQPVGDWTIEPTVLGIQLFEPPHTYSSSGGGMHIWGNNNQSGYDYPTNPDYVPSPGRSSQYNYAEAFDIEGLFYQYATVNVGGVDKGHLRVYLVTSMGPNGYLYADGFTYFLGDVFVSLDGEPTSATDYAYALLSFGNRPGETVTGIVAQGKNGTQSTSWVGTNREAGAVVDLTGYSGEYAAGNFWGINGPSSYANDANVRNAVNYWAVHNVSAVNLWGVPGGGTTTLAYQGVDYATPPSTGPRVSSWDYAGGPWDVLGETGPNPAPTYVYKWDVYIAPLDSSKGQTVGDLFFHVTVQCGNDDLDGGVGIVYGSPGTIIPAPGALLLAGIGIGGVAVARTIRRRRVR